MKVLSVLLLAALAGMVVSSNSGMAMRHDAPTDQPDDNPVELGDVKWNRDLEAAQSTSDKTGKPIFLLFQEIPGCSTCQNFGQNPLSHPLMVEAIEDLFVPVAVYNNKPGPDAELLKAFGEPSWNNPVVRFVDAKRKDIIARKDRVWGTRELAGRMVKALKQAERDVPDYLQQLTAGENLETATFAMHCYWEGEAKLGALRGVANTRSAWKENLEVVQVQFDPAVVDYKKLVASAQSFECASKIYAHNDKQMKVASSAVGDKAVAADAKVKDAKLSDQTYYLRNSFLRHLPLTELQATKINAVLYTAKSDTEKREGVANLLSPRQQKCLKLIQKRLAADPESLAKFVWPDNDEKLGVYASKLRAELETK